MAEQAPPQWSGLFRDWLMGQLPEGFKGTGGFKGPQLRRLDALNQLEASKAGLAEAGAAAKRDVGTWETGAQGKANQGAVNRGLFNTTVLDSTQRGIGSEAQRMRSSIDLGVQDRLNAIRSAMAQALLGGKQGSMNPDKPGFGDFFMQGLGQGIGKLPGALLMG